MDYLRKCLVEFIGTYFLVFTVGACYLFKGINNIPSIAIGFILMVMVYAGAHISGGHYNPAVTLAAAMRGSTSFKKLAPYWAAQFLGATAGIYSAIGFSNETIYVNCPYSPIEIIVGEFLFTFALCYVVLHTTTTEDNAGNSFYGLAIGSIVTVGILTVGGMLCFAAFNPAVALALGISKAACWGSAWITIAANLLAGVMAALIFKLTNCECN